MLLLASFSFPEHNFRIKLQQIESTHYWLGTFERIIIYTSSYHFYEIISKKEKKNYGVYREISNPMMHDSHFKFNDTFHLSFLPDVMQYVAEPSCSELSSHPLSCHAMPHSLAADGIIK